MASPTRRNEARRKFKIVNRGLKRKRLLNRDGSTKSAKDLFAVQG